MDRFGNAGRGVFLSGFFTAMPSAILGLLVNQWVVCMACILLSCLVPQLFALQVHKGGSS